MSSLPEPTAPRAAADRMRCDVLAQMQDAVVAVDNDDRILYINPAAERQYGLEASAVLGRAREALYKLQFCDDEEQHAVFETLRQYGVWRGRVAHVKQDGATIQAESAVTVLRDAAGAATGRLMVIRDVTARVSAEESLRTDDRRKDIFLATLAHELRNPLAPIANSLNVMRLSDDRSAHEQARGVIERQLRQLVHLVDDLLDVARISQGKLELRRETVDLALVVRTAVETSRPLIDAAGHELVVDLPQGEAIAVDGDLTRLTQVVANLLNNAAKYTPAGGRIEVAARRDGSDAVISVADSGIGVPPALLPHVFEMFAQVDHARDRAQGGLGIGLALVQWLVEMHGGTIEAASAGEGQGSRFVVRVPALGTLQSVHHVPVPADGAGAAMNTRVLIVDDNRDSADSMAMMVGFLGCRTATAYDGCEALQVASALRPDVVILDLGLPLMSGHDVARRMRQEPWGAQAMLIALSGWGQEEDRRKTREVGFDHHFVKPLDLATLSRLLAAAPRPASGFAS